MSDDDAVRLCDRIKERLPKAVELAEAVSLAARVEPGLLRRARLELLPNLEPGAESDLWFSPLVESYGSRALMLRPEVADVLRERLVLKPERAARAWSLVRDAHSESPPIVRIEEQVTWEALVGEFAKAETLLQRALKRMLEGPPEETTALGRWAMRAWPRWPKTVRETAIARELLFAASAIAGARVPVLSAGASAFPESAVWLLPKGHPTVAVGVLRNAEGIHFVASAGAMLPVPKTNPPVVEVSWREGERLVTTLGEAAVGKAVAVPALADGVTLRTLAGHVYSLGGERQPARLRLFDEARSLAESCVTLGNSVGYFVAPDLVATSDFARGPELPTVVQGEWQGKRLHGTQVAFDSETNCVLLRLDAPEPGAKVVKLWSGTAGPTSTLRRHWISSRGIGGIMEWPPPQQKEFLIHPDPQRRVLVLGRRNDAAAATIAAELTGRGYPVREGDLEAFGSDIECDAAVLAVGDSALAWPRWVADRAEADPTFLVIAVSTLDEDLAMVPPEFLVMRDHDEVFGVLRTWVGTPREGIPIGSPIFADGEVIGHVADRGALSHTDLPGRRAPFVVCSAATVNRLVDEAHAQPAPEEMSHDAEQQNWAAVLETWLRSQTRPVALVGPPGYGKTDIMQMALARLRTGKHARTVYFRPHSLLTPQAELLESIGRVIGGPRLTLQSVAAQLRKLLRATGPLVVAIDDFDYPGGRTRPEFRDLVRDLASVVGTVPLSLVVALQSMAHVSQLPFRANVLDLDTSSQIELAAWVAARGLQLEPPELAELAQQFENPTLQKLAIDALASGEVRSLRDLVADPLSSPRIRAHVEELKRSVDNDGLSQALADVIAGRWFDIDERQLLRLEWWGIVSRREQSVRLRAAIYSELVSQNGPWAGGTTAGGRSLTATLRRKSRKWYLLRVEMSAANGQPPLTGKVLFKLHSSFDPPERRVDVVDGVAALEEWTYGTFTVRAVTDADRIEFSLDLATIPGVPIDFLNDGEAPDDVKRQLSKAEKEPVAEDVRALRKLAGRSFNVFLSYAYYDAPVVRAIAARLEAAGFTVMLGPESLSAGAPRDHNISQALASADVALFFWSISAKGSRHVRAELGYARRSTAAGNGPTIVRVLLDGTGVPELLEGQFGVDLAARRERDMEKVVELVLGLHRLEELHTYPTPTNRYYNPPEEILARARRVEGDSFIKAVANLEPRQVLFATFVNPQNALVATHVHSKARWAELTTLHEISTHLYAIDLDLANVGLDEQIIQDMGGEIQTPPVFRSDDASTGIGRIQYWLGGTRFDAGTCFLVEADYVITASELLPGVVSGQEPGEPNPALQAVVLFPKQRGTFSTPASVAFVDSAGIAILRCRSRPPPPAMSLRMVLNGTVRAGSSWSSWAHNTSMQERLAITGTVSRPAASQPRGPPQLSWGDEKIHLQCDISPTDRWWGAPCVVERAATGVIVPFGAIGTGLSNSLFAAPLDGAIEWLERNKAQGNNSL